MMLDENIYIPITRVKVGLNRFSRGRDNCKVDNLTVEEAFDETSKNNWWLPRRLLCA